jgi:uncharacterized protein (TIGR02001 family)
MTLVAMIAPAPAFAAAWGASVGATTEYFVRGVSRSNGHAAVQADVHINTSSGLLAGLFASTVQIAPTQHRDLEISAFLGMAWNAPGAWRTRLLVSHYAYTGTSSTLHYDYDELSVDAAYSRWAAFTMTYSPNVPRYSYYSGLSRVTSASAEMSLRAPLSDRFALNAGLGYERLGGAGAAGYTYWSGSAAYDFAPWSVTLGYVGSNDAARYLYPSTAARGRWAATLIRRF